jgi:hypothetical protein
LAGTNFITVRQKNKDMVECFTECNASTHSILRLFIVNNACLPHIELNSVESSSGTTYPCEGGYFKIDSTLFKKGVLKAEFDLNFKHKENPKQKMFWKGRIYSNIEK